ncbi:MAG: RHS repeat-associated core domain-containing protein [Chloroflexota bacterium]
MTGVSGAATASFVYNGDGQRIVASEGVTTTVYLSNYVELAWNGQTAKVKKYYYAGTTRVAMRQGNAAPLLVLGDHLGSTSRVVNYDGSPIPADQLYAPWGETRFTNGSMPTQYQFTGQYRQAAIGLDYFNARWYDPSLGRFTQADTIIPEASQGVQAWNRFAGMNNNPARFTDPKGHDICGDDYDPACSETEEVGAIVPTFQSDAFLLSSSTTIGFGPWFMTGGIDVVVTSDQIGIFTVSGVGPALGGHDVSKVKSNANDEEATFVTPQWGGSVTVGGVFGDKIEDDVSVYSGTALVAGGSAGPVSAEMASSVDVKSGLPNFNITTVAVGTGPSMVPVEGHVYYVNAIYQKGISVFLSTLARFCGLLSATP